MLRDFFEDSTGATAIEYGLIAALISVAMIQGFGVFSNALNNQFQFVANTVNAP
jgi:pilus assembly protein Flp/PilA